MKKISLIGAGQIGGTMAHLCAIRSVFKDIVLFDIAEGMPQGKALDINQSNSIIGSDANVIGTNSYEDIKNSDVIIITAGLPRKPGMSRDDLIQINTKIIKTVAENVKKYSPNSFVIIVTNPLDAMVYAFEKISGLNSKKIAGMAGILDSARMSHFISKEINVSKSSISSMVLGGHGDTMVPVMNYTVANGIAIKNFDISEEKIDAIIDRTRNGGGEIVKLLGNGSAYYAPATAALSMAESYAGNQKKVLPCAVKLSGEYGVNGLYIGVPVVIGEAGIEKIIELNLSSEERDYLQKSIESVKSLVDIVDSLI